MIKAPSPRRRGPLVTFDGARFHIQLRGHELAVTAVEDVDGQEDLLIELDAITHYGDGEEIAVEDMAAILEAIEEEAGKAGLSIAFE